MFRGVLRLAGDSRRRCAVRGLPILPTRSPAANYAISAPKRPWPLFCQDTDAVGIDAYCRGWGAPGLRRTRVLTSEEEKRP